MKPSVQGKEKKVNPVDQAGKAEWELLTGECVQFTHPQQAQGEPQWVPTGSTCLGSFAPQASPGLPMGPG